MLIVQSRRRRRADAGDPRQPRRRQRRTDLAREPTLEDAYVALVGRGMRTLRLLAVGLVLPAEDALALAVRGHRGRSSTPSSSPRSPSSCSAPATARETLLYASLGAAVMGMWSATSTTAGSAMQRERWHGTLEVLVAAPVPTSRSILLPITLAMSTIGDLLLAATLLWGRLPVRHRPHDRASTSRSALAVVGDGASRSARSASCFAVSFVRFRPPGRSGTSSSTRSGSIGGFLVPLALLPSWVGPIAWVLAADLGDERDP